MTSDFLTIVITAPRPCENEAQTITMLLESGACDLVHIRRPGASEEELRSLISGIPNQLHRRLRLHDCFRLTEEFRLAGVHLNSRWPVAPASALSFSLSCHSLEEVAAAPHEAAYITLSPIYDSISKPGYCAAFTANDFKENFNGRNVIALGGVVPARFPELRQAGFAGAAMLGYVWRHSDCLPRLIDEILIQKQLCCNISLTPIAPAP